MGRTARQGNEGSYSMVLLDTDLSEFNIERTEIDAIMGDYLSFLEGKRDKKLAALL